METNHFPLAREEDQIAVERSISRGHEYEKGIRENVLDGHDEGLPSPTQERRSEVSSGGAGENAKMRGCGQE